MRSWRIAVLPFIEQDGLLERYDFKQPWDAPDNRKLANSMPNTYALHSERRSGVRTTITNYLAIVGQETVWRPGKVVKYEDITDGPSNTILIAENRGLNVHWMDPRDFDFSTMDWTINSPQGISSKYDAPAAVMVDGSVRKLSLQISSEALKALCTINGKEKLSEDRGNWTVIPDGRLRPVTEP